MSAEPALAPMLSPRSQTTSPSYFWIIAPAPRRVSKRSPVERGFEPCEDRCFDDPRSTAIILYGIFLTAHLKSFTGVSKPISVVLQ
jgi:hypothetical protein